MAAAEVDEYLRGVDEPARTTLKVVRRVILELVPAAEQGISYGVPAFKLQGRVIAGLAAFPKHLSYLPHSGSVLGELEDELVGYKRTKSSLHFAHDAPLPREIVRKLIEVRIGQLGGSGRTSGGWLGACIQRHGHAVWTAEGDAKRDARNNEGRPRRHLEGVHGRGEGGHEGTGQGAEEERQQGRG